MLTTSNEYKHYVNSNVQEVDPYVVATWADARYLENVRILSTEDPYYKRTLSLNPALFWRMNDAGFPDTSNNIVTRVQDFTDSQNHGQVINAVRFGQTSHITSESTGASTQTTTYLSCNGASGGTGSYASITAGGEPSIGGDIAIIAKFTCTLPNEGAISTIYSKWGNSTTNRAYRLYIEKNSGQVKVKFSYYNIAGTLLTKTSPKELGDYVDITNITTVPIWVKFTLDVDNGNNGNTYSFYFSLDGINWVGESVDSQDTTDIRTTGVTIASAVGADFGATSNLSTNNLVGKIFDVALYNNLNLATPVARPYFENTGSGNGKWLIGDTTDTDSNGKTWTVNTPNASIKGDSYIVAKDNLDTKLNSQNNLLIETWVDFGNMGVSSFTDGTILHRATNTTNQFEIAVESSKIVGKFYSGATAYSISDTNNIATDGTAYHIVLSLNKYNNLNILTLIINNVIKKQIIVPATINSISAPIVVGAKNNAGTYTNIATGLRISALTIYNDSSFLFRPESFAHTRYRSAIGTVNYPFSDYFDAEEVINNRSSESFAWAALDSLDNNNINVKSNPKYYLCEEDPNNTKHEYGWWSRVKSGATGTFTNTPKLFLEFDSMKFNAISVATSAIFNKIKTFNLSYLQKGNFQYNSSLLGYSTLTSSIPLEKEVSAINFDIIDDPYYQNSSPTLKTLSTTKDLTFNGGIDIQIEVAADAWSYALNELNLVSRWGTTEQNWKFVITTTGCLKFYWKNSSGTSASTTSTIQLPFEPKTKHWLRVVHTFNPTNSVVFYISDDGTNWITLETFTGVTSTTAYYSTTKDSIRIGTSGTVDYGSFVGKIYTSRLYQVTSGTLLSEVAFHILDINKTSGSTIADHKFTDASWSITNGIILRNSYIECQGIAIELTSTVYGNDRSRLIEFCPIYKTDISSDVINMNLNKTRENYDSSVPLGITGANSLDLSLDNTTQNYNKYNTNSIYYPYVDPEVKIQAALKYPKFALALPGQAGNYVSSPSSSVVIWEDVGFPFPTPTIRPLTLIVELSSNNWTPATENVLVSKWATNNQSWRFGYKTTAGKSRLVATFSATASGTSYSVESDDCPFINDQVYFVKCHISSPTSVGSAVFSYSTDGITWNDLGTKYFSIVWSAYKNDASVIIGGYDNGATVSSSIDRIRSVEILVNNITVANPNFSKNVNESSTYIIDDYGKPWTINTSGSLLKTEINKPKSLVVNNNGNVAYLNDIAPPTSSIEVICKMTLNDWFPYNKQTIATKTGEWEWYLDRDGSNKARMTFSVYGNTTLTRTTLDKFNSLFTSGTTHWLKATYTKSTGSIIFEYSENGYTWSSLTAETATGTNPTSFTNTTQPLYIGGSVGSTSDNFLNGTIDYFKLLYDGTVKSELDFSYWDSGATSGMDAQGQTWYSFEAPQNQDSLIPFGNFYVDSLDNDGSSMVTNFKCRDRSRFLQDQTMPDGFVYSEMTASKAIANLAKSGNVPISKIQIQKSLHDAIEELSPICYWRMNEVKLTKKVLPLSSTSYGSLHYTTDYPYNSDATIDNPQFYNFEIGATSLTFECWLRTDDSTGSLNIFTIQNKTNSANNDFKLTLSSGVLTFTFNNAAVAGTWSGTSALNDGDWHHIAVVCPGGGTLKTYIDGGNFGTFTSSATISAGLPTANGQLVVGGTTASTYYNITDIRIWNTARTLSQIVNNMSVELLGHETNLISYWKLRDTGKQVTSGSYEIEYLKNSTNPSYWLARNNTTANSKITLTVNNMPMAIRDSVFTTNLTANSVSGPYLLNQPKITTSATSPSILLTSSSGSRPDLVAVVNDNHLAFKQSDKTSDLQTFTFSCFLKPTIMPTGTDEAYIYSNYNTGTSKGIKISITASGYIKVYYDASSVTTTSNPISINNSYHLVVLINYDINSSTNGQIKVYLNGSAVSMPTTSLALGSRTWFPKNIYIGSNAFGSGTYYDGYISEIAIFPYALTASEIAYLYKMAYAIDQDIYPSLYGGAEDIWGSMLQIATADLGMFYFDENDNFIYEGGNRFFDPQYVSSYNSQYDLSDDSNIISCRQDFALVANSISCKIYKNVLESNGDTGEVWNAENDESLASTNLTQAISAASKTIYFDTDQETVDVYIPVFPESGYVKIDSEIIKFKQTQRGSLAVEERGALGTTAAGHNAGAGLGEVRVYNIEFSDAPIAYVKGPYIDAVYDGKVTIESWSSGSYKGYLVISAVGSSDPEYIVLNGEDILTGVTNSFFVAGIPGNKGGTDSSASASKENRDSIRKYGLKELVIDNPFIQSKNKAENIVSYLIDNYKISKSVLNASTMGLPHLQLSDKITISSYAPMNISNKNYWIMSASISYDGGVGMSLTLREV